FDYGYFWWVNPKPRTGEHPDIRYYMARGAGGQNLFVYPEKNMVVVITGWEFVQNHKIQTIFDHYILPAIQSN
ncbi:MAG: hypothetical protein NZ108_07495, partial [Bacteroidia bacterium]|nr:hypothetical protein [Bacteroidia bacterium]